MSDRTTNLLVPLSLAGLSLLGVCSYSQDKMTTAVDIEAHGSVPPVRQWYQCVRELDGKQSYDAARGKQCLKEILGHEHIKSGKIKFEPSRVVSKLVIFVLESPSLKLTGIDYGIRKELESEFRDYTDSNNLFPRIGGIYDYRDESGNESRIGNFFSAKGIMVAVSKRIDLDYRTRTASLTYKIWEGPDGPVRPLLTDCKDDPRITYFSLLDVDEFTPLNLILKSTHTRDGECFSESAIRFDEQLLRNLNIFSELNYAVGDGNGSGRGVSIHARTNGLMVSAVSIDGFGLTSTASMPERQNGFPKLPLQVTQRYRYSDAERSRKVLQDYFQTNAVHAQVFEDDELGLNRTLKVTYHVLTWPLDELYIDGQRFE
jgi:hypothetical protein